METVKMYTDGASRGNPGRAGAGVKLVRANGAPVKEVSRFIGLTTNNVAEYTAFVLGLQEASFLGAKRVEAFLDSELVVKQIRGEYKVKDDKLKPFVVLARHLIEKIGDVSVTYIRREDNKDADRLANEAIDNKI